MPRRSVNKSAKVRDYLDQNPDAKPRLVAQALKRYGVTAALVSNVKSTLKRSGQVGTAWGNGAPRRGRSAGLGGQAHDPVVVAAELIKLCGSLEQAEAALSTAGRVALVLK